MTEKKGIYSQHSIEFVKAAAEVSVFLEQETVYQKSEFIAIAVKLLPLLYLQTSMIEMDGLEPEEDMGRFVTENDYNHVKNRISTLLGEDDAFLEVFHPDIAYSDTPIAAFVSENLADIYQELKDFILNFQVGEEEIMKNSLQTTIIAFREHWGQKLLNAMRPLHKLRYGEEFGKVELPNKLTNQEDYRKIDRNSFLRFQSEE